MGAGLDRELEVTFTLVTGEVCNIKPSEVTSLSFGIEDSVKLYTRSGKIFHVIGKYAEVKDKLGFISRGG